MFRLLVYYAYAITVSFSHCVWLGGIHKPCGHGRGEGVSQISMLQHKPYLVKWSTKGGGGVKNLQKTVHMVYGCPLYQLKQSKP